MVAAITSTGTVKAAATSQRVGYWPRAILSNGIKDPTFAMSNGLPNGTGRLGDKPA
jgi:hypothetical protein